MEKNLTIQTKNLKRKKKKQDLNIIMVSPNPSLMNRLNKIANEKNTDVGSLIEGIIEDWLLQKKRESSKDELLSEIEEKLDEMTKANYNIKKIKKKIKALKTKPSKTMRDQTA